MWKIEISTINYIEDKKYNWDIIENRNVTKMEFTRSSKKEALIKEKLGYHQTSSHGICIEVVEPKDPAPFRNFVERDN